MQVIVFVILIVWNYIGCLIPRILAFSSRNSFPRAELYSRQHLGWMFITLIGGCAASSCRSGRDGLRRAVYNFVSAALSSGLPERGRLRRAELSVGQCLFFGAVDGQSYGIAAAHPHPR